MRALRCLAVLSLGALAGCSLVLKPDYDAIAPDLDGGPRPFDAGDAGDAGDGGVDGGSQCEIRHPREMDCRDMVDDDCDGQIDCFDFDCTGALECCRDGAAAQRSCLSSLSYWHRFPTGTSDIALEGSCDAASITAFGSPGSTRALISADCQPINFGMRCDLDFVVQRHCGVPPCDYAALSLTPVATLLEGARLSSELRAVVFADGSARVERSGTVLAEVDPGTFVVDTAEPVHLRMDLEPGVHDDGDVLYATVQLTQNPGPRGGTILARAPVMPLDDLRCVGGDAGLYAAIEGSGRDVGVAGPFEHTQYQCSNPSQFEAQPDADFSTPLSCAAGGIGAPALVNYCYDNCDTTSSQQIQWDLWVDASDIDRGQENYRFIDFGVCGYAHQDPALPNGANGDWLLRPASSGSFMWGDSPSSREPTLLAISDQASPRSVQNLMFAYAERSTGETYSIRGGTVQARPTIAPARSQIQTLLSTDDTSGQCTSLRDPLLVADWSERSDGVFAVTGAWLFFTCVHAEEPLFSIGVAHIDTDLVVDKNSVRTDVLTPAVGPYASRGVSAPEGFSEARGTQTTVRLWFSAHDDSGRVRMAYAQGRGRIDAPDLPALEPYPANPILDGASAILGGGCSRDCTFQGVSVTRSMNDVGMHPFVVARSRDTATETVYELVPLLQPAPND